MLTGSESDDDDDNDDDDSDKDANGINAAAHEPPKKRLKTSHNWFTETSAIHSICLLLGLLLFMTSTGIIQHVAATMNSFKNYSFVRAFLSVSFTVFLWHTTRKKLACAEENLHLVGNLFGLLQFSTSKSANCWWYLFQSCCTLWLVAVGWGVINGAPVAVAYIAFWFLGYITWLGCLPRCAISSAVIASSLSSHSQRAFQTSLTPKAVSRWEEREARELQNPRHKHSSHR